ncbi:MAG: hypothetical protein ACI92E_001842 [Oceanicoccus sp.]|jgi:hypothetical protein
MQKLLCLLFSPQDKCSSNDYRGQFSAEGYRSDTIDRRKRIENSCRGCAEKCKFSVGGHEKLKK